MLHEPAPQEQGVDNAANYKMRLGVQMFLAYAAFYLGFVLINVISPVTMEAKVLLGMNLATVYGFALICVALILALIYNHMCTTNEKAVNTDAPAQAENREEK
jgi:uncharacterized membrane protein (DUF485 family)